MNCSTEKKERLGPLDIQQTGQTWRCQAVANIGRIIIKANRRSETQGMFVRVVKSVCICLPDICQFWGTTTLFRPVKWAPKSAYIR